MGKVAKMGRCYMPYMNRYKKLRLLSWIVCCLMIVVFTQTMIDLPVSGQIPLLGKVIMIDPGHGGADGGAVSKDGLVEKEVTLKISKYLRDFLQQGGAKVIMIRESDRDLSDPDLRGLSKKKSQDLMRRVEMVRKTQPDLLISIHLNAFPGERWHGAQTFYNPANEENKKLASFIQKSLIVYLENTQRIPKAKNDVYLLKYSPVPTALVETGFLSNPKEASLLASKRYQKKVAAAIYYGILNYYSGKKIPEFTI